MIKDPVLNAVTFLMVPFIILFALYIQFHGDYTPGGGFQAGIIIASGIILYSMLILKTTVMPMVIEFIWNILVATLRALPMVSSRLRMFLILIHSRYTVMI